MPNQTFFNLPDEKRNVLIDAAKKEFSRAPLYEASISNIIKEADIARGSFYQYFEDKEDLYFYLLQKDAQARRDEFLAYLTENNGDLFSSLLEEFKSMLIEVGDKDVKNFYRHVFLNMNYKTERTFMSNKQDSEFDLYMIDIKEQINTEQLNLIEEEDLAHIIKISTSILFQNLIDKFARNLPNDKAIHNYEQQLNLLQRGFVKR